jgi:hypothetical protein
LQKSLPGLYRSLLHDILQARPELIATVFPELWEEVKSRPWQIQTELSLSIKEIRSAFVNLIKSQHTYDDLCFCFFIDGLDEYVGTHQEDHMYLTQLLRDWTNSEPRNVKICVSSREDNVFLNAFSSKQRIRLQDLTRHDMERYIRDKLAHISDSVELGNLMDTTIQKANGIFLWLALAVKTIRRRLEDSHTLLEIQKELDSLPLELEDLLQHVFNLIKESSPKRAYFVFKAIRKLDKYQLKLSLLQYSFLDDYDRDPDFATKTLFPYSKTPKTQLVEKLRVSQRKLTGDCRGLVEVDDEDIIFTHRSIPEFLNQDEIQQEIDSHPNPFYLEVTLSQLLLADIRLNGEEKLAYSNSLDVLLYAMIDIQSQIKPDDKNYHFWESIDSIDSIFGLTNQKCPDACSNMYHSIKLSKDRHFHLGGFIYEEGFHATPIQISAFIGEFDYLVWKMQRDPLIRSNFRTGCYLAWSICGALVEDTMGCFQILELVLRDGLDPNAHIFTKDSDLYFGDGTWLTFWQAFVGYAALNSKPREYRPATQKIFGELLRMLLEHDVDPYIWIDILLEERGTGDDSNHTKLSYFYESLIFGKERRKLKYRYVKVHSAISAFHGNRRELSLRDIIEYWRLDNTADLLQLLDEKFEKERMDTTESIIIQPQNIQIQRKGQTQRNGEATATQYEPANCQSDSSDTSPRKDIPSKLAGNSTLAVQIIWFKHLRLDHFLIVLLGTNAS